MGTKRKHLFRSIVVSVLVTAASLAGIPAEASAAAQSESPEDATSVLSALAQHGLVAAPRASQHLQSPPKGSALSSLDSTGGLRVKTRARAALLQLRPATRTQGVIRDGVLVFPESPSYGYALTTRDVGADAGYVVINNASAPTSYSFEVLVDGLPARLQLDGERVRIADSNGEFVNSINPAWAVDAERRSIPTSYSVHGNTLTQHVDHAGAAYPVVADPGLSCDWLFCTYMCTRSQTSFIADYGSVGAALVSAGCGAIAAWVGGALCAAYGAWVVGAANDARNQGRCLGLRHFNYSSPAYIWPVIENC